MRILVVDDDEMIRALAVKILERAGHVVMTADSGKEGVELVVRNPQMIDVALVDQTMPGMTGLDTIREMRKFSDSLPCIISSSGSFPPEAIPVDLRSQTFLLQKPYRPQHLVSTILAASKTG